MAVVAATQLPKKAYNPGDYIFREGEVGVRAYIVDKGVVEILKQPLNSSKELILGRIPEGGIFGEMSLIDESPRMASARCAHASVISVISREVLEDHMKGLPPFMRLLLRSFMTNLRDTANQALKLHTKVHILEKEIQSVRQDMQEILADKLESSD